MSAFVDEQARRRAPRLTDTDWLILRALRAAISAFADLAKPGMRAIDFGCGAQPYADLFTARGVAYVGADFGAGADIDIGPDGRLAAPDLSADLVLSFQVLEHVRDLDTYFAEARRVLAPDGRMILSTHGVWLYHPHPEDHRRWTREGLINDIEARGFRVEEWRAIVGPLAWTTMFRLMGFAHMLRKIPLIGPTLAGALSIVMNLRAALEDRMTPPPVVNDNACVYIMLCRPEPAQ